MKVLLAFIFTIVFLVFIFLTIRCILKKKPKNIMIHWNFVEGFKISCSFFENE